MLNKAIDTIKSNFSYMFHHKNKMDDIWHFSSLWALSLIEWVLFKSVVLYENAIQSLIRNILNKNEYEYAKYRQGDRVRIYPLTT